MRTLSARILLGLVALTITFGAFVGTIVVNLREVEDQASLVLGGYVPLAMVSSDLAQRHSDLQAYLDQGIFDANQPNEVTSAIQNLRLKRELALKEIIKTLNGIGERINSNGQAA